MSWAKHVSLGEMNLLHVNCKRQAWWEIRTKLETSYPHPSLLPMLSSVLPLPSSRSQREMGKLSLQSSHFKAIHLCLSFFPHPFLCFGVGCHPWDTAFIKLISVLVTGSARKLAPVCTSLHGVQVLLGAFSCVGTLQAAASCRAYLPGPPWEHGWYCWLQVDTDVCVTMGLSGAGTQLSHHSLHDGFRIQHLKCTLLLLVPDLGVCRVATVIFSSLS